jgi:hypothetical protein
MFRSRLILIAIAALASVASGLAQDAEISIDSRVSPEQIKEWLQASDSHLVAWGARKSDDGVDSDLYYMIMSRRLAIVLVRQGWNRYGRGRYCRSLGTGWKA